MKKYIVNKKTDITSFLIENSIKKSDIKTYLKYNCISINGSKNIKYNTLLKENDVVIINSNNTYDLDVIYEDKEIIAINKPCGLLTDKTDKESYNTAFNLVKEYLKIKHEKVFLVHRLDQHTSGVLMFVKNKKEYDLLTSNWNDYVLRRNYIALVEGDINPKENRIETYLFENKAMITRVTNNPYNNNKKAITNYTTIRSNNNYSLLDINIETGRKNQIRAHLSYLGYPIAGDHKYGAKTNPIKRLALHANLFCFKHPITNKVYTFEAKYPGYFNSVFNND